MAWPTTATDGQAVGNLEFLSNYWHHQNQDYELRDAIIQRGISPEKNWDHYEIRCLQGVSFCNLRESLRPIVHQIVGVPEGKPLEGTAIDAYYKDNVFVGFRSHTEK